MSTFLKPIRKQDNIIEWIPKDEFFSWLLPHDIVYDTDFKPCFKCKSLLETINENEIWYSIPLDNPIIETDKDLFICHSCYIKDESKLIEAYLSRYDRDKRIPSHFVMIHKEIYTHRNYHKLKLDIRDVYERCLRMEKAQNRQIPEFISFISNIWYHLHYGIKLII